MASRRTKKFWALFFGCALLLFITISLTGYSYFRLENANSLTPTFSVLSPGSTYNVNELKSQPMLLNVGVGFTAFDPAMGLKTELGFAPQNKLANNHNEPTAPVCMNFQNTDFEFKANETMSAEALAVLFTGNTRLYPFDTYTGQIIIHAHTGEDSKSCNQPLAINPVVLGSTLGFVVSAQVFPGVNDDNSPDYSSARVMFTVRRVRQHQLFSCLIFLVMWAMSGILFYITAWTWKGGKRVELGIIAMNTALLYAIPRVRDSQPNVPKLGIIQDLCGYCWNVALVAISLLSLMINFILRKERKKDDRKGTREDGSTLLMVLEEILDDD